MRNERKKGLLVVGHGSRREEANTDLRRAARLIAARGGAELVEAAFLEIESPNIAEGFARLVERGARSITVHPYFLSPGRHTRGDLPVKVAEAAANHPGISFLITEPLTSHDLVIQASIERIRETEGYTAPKSLPATVADQGKVYIVGAGPGDPELLTLKAHNLLRSCDAVVYDYLVNPEILGLIQPFAEKIYVGKIGGGRQTPQTEINEILIEKALQGKSVVRLKGGDPFIFGRGGEEAAALRALNISFEIVPGISSAIAAPAYAGIPLTHRSLSASFAVLTGTRVKENSGFVPELAKFAAIDTLVILMGVQNLREISRQLIQAGREADTPAAVIRWGTYNGQEVVTGNLENIAEEAEKADFRAPAVIVVGEVVRLREHLSWFETAAPNFGFAEQFGAAAVEVAF
jgi:uroporphyrin-III C-methyltransferase